MEHSRAAAADKSLKFNTNIGMSPEGIANGIIDLVEDFDEPDECYAKSTYATASTRDQKRIPGKVASAHAGVGVARVKRGLLEAEAKGPQAGAVAKAHALGVEATAGSSAGNAYAKVGPCAGVAAQGPNAGANAHANVSGVGAGFNLGVGGVSGSIGPLSGTLGLNVDTGVSAGLDGVSAKVLGTGFSIGGRDGFSISVFGSSIRFF